MGCELPLIFIAIVSCLTGNSQAPGLRQPATGCLSQATQHGLAWGRLARSRQWRGALPVGPFEKFAERELELRQHLAAVEQVVFVKFGHVVRTGERAGGARFGVDVPNRQAP